MRRIVLTGICALLLTAGCNCEDTESGDGGNGSMDAGDLVSDVEETTEPDGDAEDAEDAEDVQDAVDGDGAEDVVGDADATQNDADAGQQGMASITVEYDGQPVSGADLLVHAPDGSLADQLQTDSQGVAEFDVSPGGMVTVAQSQALPEEFPTYYTVTDVQIGDEILVDRARDVPEAVGTLEATTAGPFNSISDGIVSIGCDTKVGQSLNNPIQLTINEGCPQNGESVDVLGMVQDSDDLLLAFASEPSVQKAESDPTQVTLPSWKTDFRDVDIELTGLTSTIDYYIYQTVVARGVIFEVSYPNAFDYAEQTITEAVRYPAGFGDATRPVIQLRYEITSELDGRRSIVTTDQGTSTDKAVSLSTDALLPRLASAEVQSAQTNRPTVAWTFDSAGGGTPISEAQGGTLDFEWSPPEGQSGDEGEWRVTVPSDIRSFEFPELPAGASKPGAGLDTTAVVTFYSLEAPADWDALRNDPLTGYVDSAMLRERFENARTTGTMGF